MSVFELSEIAPLLEKGPRTLRRWCQREIVPGAFCTGGGKRGVGHWRIRGESLQAVVESVRAAAPKNSRRRKENAYPGAVVMTAKKGFGVWLRMDASIHHRTKNADEVSARCAREEHERLGSKGLSNWWLLAPPNPQTPREAWRRLRERDPEAAVFQQHCRRRRRSRSARMVFWYSGKKAFYDLRLKSQREQFMRDAVEGFHAACALTGAGDSGRATFDGQTFKRAISASAVAKMAGISMRTFYAWFPGWKRNICEGVAALQNFGRHNNKVQLNPNSSGLAFEKAGKDRSTLSRSVPFPMEETLDRLQQDWDSRPQRAVS